MIGITYVRADNFASKYRGTITNTDESKFALFDEKDAQMFEEIKAITGDDGVINNFNDSSIWAYTVCGVNASAKANVASYMSETDRDLVEVTANLSTLGDGSDYSNQLKEKAMRLNYRYVLQLDSKAHLVADFNDRGNWIVNDLGAESVVSDSTAGYSLVGSWNVRSGNYKLYAIEF